MLVKFPISTDGQVIQDYFEKHGYVIFEGLTDPLAIDSFLSEYEKIKRSKHFFYYSQSIHRWIKPELTEHGFIRESFENSTRLLHARPFADAVKRVLYSSSVSDALSKITGYRDFVSWQDMFFDRSTGTIDHQDSWYLDTDPHGHVTGAWFALEDIHPDCGPFYVYPGSHKLPRLTKDLDHETFRKQCLDLIQESGTEKRRALLKRGDVLFWHPSTLHGADHSVDPRYSRKSFTSHFYPLGMRRFGVHPGQSSVGSLRKDLKGVRPTHSEHIYQLVEGDANPLKFTAKGWLKYALEGRKGARMDMRRASYDQ